jgi:hypothetical protein
MVHLIGVPTIFLAGVYLGYRYGFKGLAAVKAEVAAIERELGALANVTTVLARLKAKL